VLDIQANLNDHALAKKEPEILFLMQSLATLFLKPIESILPPTEGLRA
jgi:hypothetical protein